MVERRVKQCNYDEFQCIGFRVSQFVRKQNNACDNFNTFLKDGLGRVKCRFFVNTDGVVCLLGEINSLEI